MSKIFLCLSVFSHIEFTLKTSTLSQFGTIDIRCNNAVLSKQHKGRNSQRNMFCTVNQKMFRVKVPTWMIGYRGLKGEFIVHWP